MNKPLAWSFSALDQFKNCPRQYYEVRVAKNVKEEPSDQMLLGNRIHKAFENRVKHGTELPNQWKCYEDYLSELASHPGEIHAEQKVALDLDRKPCGFFDKRVWWRGVIDYANYHNDHALLVDYKTGKRHQKWEQLYMSAIWVFTARPEINVIDAAFYWTQSKSHDVKAIHRSELPDLWQSFLPDLKQYKQAFKDDTWQPRPSGLCHGWCPVTDCEHWREKRKK